MSRVLTETVGASFREDAPRPPVPGEEGEGSCRSSSKSVRIRPLHGAKAVAVAPPGCTPRRNEDGLGEPEGSASPDSPLARWTKSLHFLLGDQDGAHLFRTFLEREKCEDTLDFWFACNGFRQMDLKDPKTQRVARAIYKRYIENDSVVAQQMKPATKSYIRDSVKKQQIDSSMFDQAQTEIQTSMEENAYQLFLASDIYLDYVRSGCESSAYEQHGGLGNLRLMCGYLPPLIEDKEWTCSDFKTKALATVVGLSASTLRATMSLRTTDILEQGCRARRRGGPASPYFVNSGHVFAPASSANDSEVSSDATTDDSMSMTDSSSVDGIPPYKLVTRKQLQREMHRSVKINGQVALPHFPRTQRLPREMAPVEPSAFAAELISRLEKLKRERDTLSSLEERLQQIQEEEERDESELSGGGSHLPPPSLSLLPSGYCEEDPQAILDEHLSRVLKTPGCQSPDMPGYSPRARSPDRHHHHLHHRQGLVSSLVPGLACSVPSKTLAASPRPCTKHVHHHYVHHHGASAKSKEEIEAEAAHRVAQCLGSAGSDYSFQRCHIPAELVPGSQGLKKLYPTDVSSKTALWGSGGMGTTVRGHHPGHPFVQDPTMPPLPPPNTLTQLEEACRRLEEASRPVKQRYVQELSPGHSDTRETGPHRPYLARHSRKEQRRPSGGNAGAPSGSELVVTYFFCGEEIPYRRLMKTHSLTLGHFKEQLRKKGNYRYYFKKASDEFECGAVFEEIWDDGSVLPMYEGKILGKVERMD
uniref:Axin-2 n=1 Tax=Electrophorus electricus TaxID=8005 RepID=A0A4W4EJE4_ELEEL